MLVSPSDFITILTNKTPLANQISFSAGFADYPKAGLPTRPELSSFNQFGPTFKWKVHPKMKNQPLSLSFTHERCINNLLSVLFHVNYN